VKNLTLKLRIWLIIGLKTTTYDNKFEVKLWDAVIVT
jgi:hypothetical protein